MWKKFLSFNDKEGSQRIRAIKRIISKDEKCTAIDSRLVIAPTTKIEIQATDRVPRFVITQEDGTYVTLEADCMNSMMQWIQALRSCTFVNNNKMENFEIISVIGRGFYGKVMLVKEIDSGHMYALKTIHKSKLAETNYIHTVLVERSILAKTNHPFIIGMKFAFQTSSKFYFGLEYAPGGELFFHMQKVGHLPIEEVRFYIAELTEALNYLHSNGIVYRDLKPENILLDADGHVKLTDFGLSKDLNMMNSTSTFCGTPEYLAPELVRHQNYGYPIDWWALGVLTYELLYGVTPFYSQNRTKLLQNIVKSAPPFPNDVDPTVSDFITTVLVKNPEKRPGYDVITKHPFFQGIDFKDVGARKLIPPFVPDIHNKNIPENFDQEFTQEVAADSYVAPVFGSLSQLSGFSFTNSLGMPSSIESNSSSSESIEDGVGRLPQIDESKMPPSSPSHIKLIALPKTD